MSWRVKNFSQKVLNISVIFEDPIHISINEVKDSIIFEAKNASEIFKAINGFPLNMTESVKECPIQIGSSSFE